MHFIRRAALRAASSSPSTSVISKQRSITTSSPFALRSKIQNQITPAAFRQFSEKTGVESADGEQGVVSEAIEAAKEGAESLKGSTPSRNYDRESGFGRDNDRGFSPRGRAPGARPEIAPSPSLYVGNLLFEVTGAALEQEFEEFGKVIGTTIATDARGLSKGFGYVHFDNIESATAAIAAKNQSVLEGRRVIVNYMAKTSRLQQNTPPSKTLFIGNLAFEMSDADLNKLFRDIRNVIDVRVAIDRRTGQPRGFAHADFIDIESATKAREQLTDKEIYGRKLRVDYSDGGRSGERAPRRDSQGESTF